MGKGLNHPAKPVVEIEFAELPDGSLVEMIEGPANPAKSLLAGYKNDLPLLKHIRLPQGAEPYGELKDPEADVGSFFHFCLDIDPRCLVAMTACVFSTWVPEKLPVAPYLSLVGPPGSGKSRPCGYSVCCAAAAC